MRTSKCRQPTFDGVLSVFDARRGSQTLRRDRAHGSKGVFDAVMKLIENELLELVSRFPLLRVNSSLCEQGIGIDCCLFEQQAKTFILRC